MSHALRFLLLPAAALAAVSLPLALFAGCNAQVSTVLSSQDGGSAAEAGAGSSGGGATATCTTDPECNDDPSQSTLWGACVAGVCECTGDKLFSGKCGPRSKVGVPDITPDCLAKGGVCDANKEPHSVPDYLRAAAAGEAKCADADAVCLLPKQGRAMVPICYNDTGCNGNNAVSAQWGTCRFGLCHCKPGFTVQLDGKCNVAPPPTCANQGGTCRQNTCMATELFSASATDATCPDDAETFCCNAKASCTGGAQEASGAGWVPVDFECCAKGKGTAAPACVNGFQTCVDGASPVPKGSTCN